MAKRLIMDTPYPAIVAEKIPVPVGRELTPEESKVFDRKLTAKYRALLDYYALPGKLDDPSAGWWLAFALACDHIKGFAPFPDHSPQPRHRPRSLRVGQRDLAILLTGVRAERSGRSQEKAIHRLAAKMRQTGQCRWSDATVLRHYRRLRHGKVMHPGMVAAARHLDATFGKGSGS